DFCPLELDPNSANRNLRLSDSNRKVTHVSKEEHPARYDYSQLLCRTGVTGRCYWEVEW
ncbi:hypothetical protein LDENG_00053880, partial [Lucifuga dentata]